MNSAANFVLTFKTGLPRVVLVLRWVLFVPEIFVSPLSEFEQHIYSSDPRTDTGSLMQLESRRTVPQASQPPIIQSLSQDILIIPQLDGREVKNHCRLRDHAHFFHFHVFKFHFIASKSFSSAKAALVCSFRACGKNRRHLGCSNVMRSRGCAVQNKGITLKAVQPNSFSKFISAVCNFQNNAQETYLFVLNL